MSTFEYVVGIHSVVLGLAAANVLSAIAESLKYRDRIQHDWVHSGWCVYFLFLLAALWFGIWEIECSVQSQTIFEFLVLFQWTVFSYVASRLLTPDTRDRHSDQRWQYFLSIKTPFFACMLIPTLIFIGTEALSGSGVRSLGTTPIIIATSVAIVVLYAAGIMLKSRHAQAAVLPLIVTAHLVQELNQPGIILAVCARI